MALALAWLGACAPAAAAAGPQINVVIRQASGLPGAYFTVRAQHGAHTRAGWIELSNPSSQSLTVRLRPVNGLTAGTLGSLYATPAQTKRGSTGWLSLGAQTVVVPPHGEKGVEVVVRVPTSAGAGDYLSGVAAETLGSSRTTSAANGLEIGEAYRHVVGVETQIPGPRQPHIRFTGASVVRYPSEVVFLLSAMNDGNVILKNVHGWVKVTRGAKPVVAQTIPPGSFISHTAIELPVPAPRQQPAAGTRYHVRAELIYTSGVAYLDTGVTFGRRAAQVQAQYTPHARRGSGVPWLAILAGGLAALLTVVACWWCWFWRRRRYPLRQRATVALLRRRLATSAARGAPLSLISLDPGVPPSRALNRRIAKLVRPALRGSDRLGDRGGGRLVVVLPDTGQSLATGMASELTAVFVAAGLDDAVASAHSFPAGSGAGVEQLLAETAPPGQDDQSADHLDVPLSA